MLKFNRSYFILTLVLFITEILIARYVHDRIIRPYVGDLLVVFLMFCFLKSFLSISTSRATFVVLLFSYFVEWLQYLHLVDQLGWRKYPLARIVIGTSFSWEDLVVYTLAAAVLLLTGHSSFSRKNGLQF